MIFKESSLIRKGGSKCEFQEIRNSMKLYKNVNILNVRQSKQFLDNEIFQASGWHMATAPWRAEGNRPLPQCHILFLCLSNIRPTNTHNFARIFENCWTKRVPGFLLRYAKYPLKVFLNLCGATFLAMQLWHCVLAASWCFFKHAFLILMRKYFKRKAPFEIRNEMIKTRKLIPTFNSSSPPLLPFCSLGVKAIKMLFTPSLKAKWDLPSAVACWQIF